MGLPSAGDGISRRTALNRLGASALGLAFINTSLLADDSKEEAARISSFNEHSRTLLTELLSDSKFGGRIPPSTVDALGKSENASADEIMFKLLPLAQSYSRAPISNFYVGVVVRGESGSLYLGANIEVPGQCLGFAVHAEQAALSNAYMNSEQSVTALSVVGGMPCGHCRQFMEEISPDGSMTILVPGQAPAKLSSILPAPFGPAALGAKQGALPVRKTNLVLASGASDPLANAALDAAMRSYAPYSKSPAGISIRTTAGRIFQGSYIENVAFNPSLSPLQTALVPFIAAGEKYGEIAGVTLVELQGATISQRPVTETVLAAIAPQVKLAVVGART